MFLGILVLSIFTYDFIVKNNDLWIGIPINQPVFHGMFKLDTVLYLSWLWLTRKTTSEVRPTRDFRCAWILRGIAMECLWWWSIVSYVDLTWFDQVHRGLWYWLVGWNMNSMFPYILGIIIPTDELIIFRGLKPPTRIDISGVKRCWKLCVPFLPLVKTSFSQVFDIHLIMAGWGWPRKASWFVHALATSKKYGAFAHADWKW